MGACRPLQSGTNCVVSIVGFGTNNVLYTMDGDGSEYSISAADGSGTLVGNTGSQFWLDLAGYPGGVVPPTPNGTPEPRATALLSGLVSCSALFAMRGRSRTKK